MHAPLDNLAIIGHMQNGNLNKKIPPEIHKNTCNIAKNIV